MTVIDNQASANSTDTCVDGSEWDDSPEGVRKWLEWFDSAPPVLDAEELENFEETLRELRASRTNGVTCPVRR